MRTPPGITIKGQGKYQIPSSADISLSCRSGQPSHLQSAPESKQSLALAPLLTSSFPKGTHFPSSLARGRKGQWQELSRSIFTVAQQGRVSVTTLPPAGPSICCSRESSYWQKKTSLQPSSTTSGSEDFNFMQRLTPGHRSSWLQELAAPSSGALLNCGERLRSKNPKDNFIHARVLPWSRQDRSHRCSSLHSLKASLKHIREKIKYMCQHESERSIIQLSHPKERNAWIKTVIPFVFISCSLSS